MKKLLLSLIAVAGFTGLAYADEVTFDFESADNITAWGYTAPKSGQGTVITKDKPIVEGAVSIAVDNGSITNNDQKIRFFYSTAQAHSGLELRNAKKGTGQKYIFTADGGAATITKIDFTVVGTAFALKDGETALTNNTWSGSSTKVELTTTGANTFTAIKVTYTPSGKEAADLSFDNQSVTVIQGETYAGQTVKNPNNLTVTYASDDENVAEVDANTGAITMGTELGTATITASTDGDATHASGTASYTITVVKAVANLAEFNVLAKGDEALVNCELTVTYCDASSNAFVTDGTHYQLIFKQSANFTYKTGDVLNSGWKAKMDNYQGLPEMLPVGDLPSVKEEGTYTPDEITAADVTEANINRVVVLKNVVFAAATPAADASAANRNYTGKVGDTEINFFNKFKNASVEAGTYNVTGVVGINNAKLQITPISFEATTTNAIDSIVADDAAEAEYYNLQGVRVAAPESGLYIVRRGNKVTKELVK